MDAHTLFVIRVATEAMHLSIKKNGGDGAGKVQDQTKMYVHIYICMYVCISCIYIYIYVYLYTYVFQWIYLQSVNIDTENI